MRIFKKLLLLLLLVGNYLNGIAQNADIKSLNDFMEMRYGLFIHWGPVSLRATEIGWSRGHQVPTADYDKLYQEFNPVLFDADKIVADAKAAGMRYLTITAKHHDGFCLWPSAYTDYDIAHTPYKKDIVGALAKACKKADIAFCIYYSVCDWHHPDYPIHRSGDKDLDPKADISKYVAYMKNQLRELVKNYDPTMMWFDGAWEEPWTEEMGKEVYAYLKELKPTLIVNNRLGKEIAALENKQIDIEKMIGDFDTPEQVVGRHNPELPWESCFTLCKQWAWKPNDEMKSLKACLDIISRTVGGNGNLLLNVGPMPDGRIERRQVERLQEIGDWLKVNGTAVYGTTAGPYPATESYATTQRGKTLYVHVLDTAEPAIVLPDFTLGSISKAEILGGAHIKFEQKDKDLKLLLPADKKGTINYVIAINL